MTEGMKLIEPTKPEAKMRRIGDQFTKIHIHILLELQKSCNGPICYTIRTWAASSTRHGQVRFIYSSSPRLVSWLKLLLYLMLFFYQNQKVFWSN